MITVTLFEDHEPLRATLGMLIETDATLKLLGAYDRCDDVATLLKGKQRPDVIIMDINMPGIGGIAGVKIAKSMSPETQIIMFTMYEDENSIFECLKNGASGYLLKKNAHTQLLDAIKDVYRGGTPMSPEISKKVIRFFAPLKTEPFAQLTDRELEMLQLLSYGFSYRELAIKLKLSIETVRTHLKSVYQKMHVASGVEAVAQGLRSRIIK